MATPSPLTKNLKHQARFLVSDNADEFFFANRGDLKGFGRFDRASGKVVTIGAPICGPLALTAAAMIGVEPLEKKTIRVVDRTTGILQSELPPVGFGINRLLWSSNQRWLVAMDFEDHQYELSYAVFDLSKPKPRGSQRRTVSTIAFVGPDELLTEDDEQPLRTNLATGRELAVRWPDTPRWVGPMTERDGLLLTHRGVLDLATGTIVNLGNSVSGRYELTDSVYAWGIEPGTVVRADRIGQVEVLDLKGKRLHLFMRPRRWTPLAAMPFGKSIVFASTSFIEVHSLADPKQLPTTRAEKKPRSPRTKVTSAATGVAKVAALRQAAFDVPEDTARLSVWADALTELGDPRGEFIALHLMPKRTVEQNQHLERLYKLGGKLVGPAREYLRTWHFGDQGLVTTATCEVKHLVAGFDEIAALNPNLSLTVTSLRAATKKLIAAMSQLELGRLGTLNLDGSSMTDERLALLAPAMKGLRALSLFGNAVTAAGFLAVAPHLSPRLLNLTVDEGVAQGRRELLAALPNLKELNHASTSP